MITFTVPAALADEAAAVLVAHGAMGCAVAGMTRPGERRRKTVRLRAYFERLPVAERRRITLMLARARMIRAPRRRASKARTLIDPGWATRWRARFAPLTVGRRFIIAPPWRKAAGIQGRIAIIILPAQAFGTGRHPSTRGAMLALEELFAERRLTPMLDVGTGSGILAIAARLLGARRVVAIDNDPAALVSARENARLSRVRAIRFSAAPLARIRGRFGLIAANITSRALIELAPGLKRLLAWDGRLVLAGILARETPAVLRACAPGLQPVKIRTLSNWTTLVLARAAEQASAKDLG